MRKVLVTIILGLPVVLVSLLSCYTDAKNENVGGQKIIVIFDTDMGNDVDDVLALDMLYKYLDQDRIKLLGIATTKKSPYCVEYIDIMNTWYGYPDIPIGLVEDGSEKNNNDNFIRIVSQMEKEGNPAFERTVNNYEELPGSVALYRKLLAEQEDNSVNIISVGFSTNLAQLLDSQSDEYSPLTGKELVAKKVKTLSAMMGNFQDESFSEFNVKCDIPAAQKVVNEWPTTIVASPYMEMPYDRQTWDLTSVLYIVERNKGFFGESSPGTISIDEKGVTRFTPNEEGRHRYLTVTEQQRQQIRDYFIDLITQKPKMLDN